MIDAAACGLPIVVNDQLRARERVDGNGLTYRLGDVDDLAAVIRRLFDPSIRSTLGRAGARKVADSFSWEGIARQRLHDYEAAIEARGARS
jgi:glycosyltransferase involved in cell wall biosynthesis